MEDKETNLKKLDSRNRLSIVSPRSRYYSYEELADGEIRLRPKLIADPSEVISEATQAMIIDSIQNYAKGNVSQPVNFNDFRDQIDANNDDEELDFSDFSQLSGE